MLTATLTSFSSELGLVSHFCLNKMFDTVSDLVFFLPSWMCFSLSSVHVFFGKEQDCLLTSLFFFWLYII